MLDARADRHETTETQAARIHERTDRLTPANARATQKLVDRLVRETRHLLVPLTDASIYAPLKHHFRAGSYREVADDRYDEVLAYLRDELRYAASGETPKFSHPDNAPNNAPRAAVSGSVGVVECQRAPIGTGAPRQCTHARGHAPGAETAGGPREGRPWRTGK